MDHNPGNTMKGLPLLPPRGVFVPTYIIFHPELPSAVLTTWIKLRCLAWDGWATAPFNLSELASLIGIHPARLQKHLSQLQGISTLSCRIEQNGKIIVSFPEAPSIKPGHIAGPVDFPASPVPNLRNSELPVTNSYYPARIMGYLSFDEDQEVFSTFECTTDLESGAREVTSDFLNTQNSFSDHPTRG